jgi:predicted HTH transcriptional regulator
MSSTAIGPAPKPRSIYDDPQSHLGFIAAPSDDTCEGQHFDRKEAARPNPGSGGCSRSDFNRLQELVQETVSAFTNAGGGLLVLGVSKTGGLCGVGHLSEEQINSLLRLDNKLVGHNCAARLAEVTGVDGHAIEIALFLARTVDRAICEEVGGGRRAWVRSGRQNLPLNGLQREQLARDRKVVDFERREACPYDAREMDEGVLREFAEGRTNGSAPGDPTELLYQAGASIRDDAGHLALTQAGLLFFAANPQRVLPYAHIRLTRFGVPFAERERRQLPDAQRIFGGPITKQIQDFRAFVRESAFFKSYQVRDTSGGFREEPELPPIAVDEAVVNAVAHRDYAVGIPIECEKYTDALLVRSAGPVLQQHHVPDRFTLDEVRLDHLPRNRHLIDWLKSIRDAKGSPFVQALREGTRRMLSEMISLGLPAPEYSVGPVFTEVVLYSDAPRREVEFAKAASAGRIGQTTEWSNLFLLTSPTLEFGQGNADGRRREVMHALADRLKVSDWFIDSIRFGEIVAHLRGSELGAPPSAAKIVRVYPACAFQVRAYLGRAYLVVDPTVVVQSVLSVSGLLREVAPAQLAGLHAYADCGTDTGGWQRVRLVQAAPDLSRVQLLGQEREQVVPSNRVIPRLPREMIDDALQRAGIAYDLTREVRRALPSGTGGASRARAGHTRNLVASLAQDVFPLHLPGGDVALSLDPLPLATKQDSSRTMPAEGLREPEVEFGGEHSGSDIRDGISRHGSYGHERREIEIVPICGPDHTDAMRVLIQRLQAGKFKYRGAERTFSTRLTYRAMTTASPTEARTECERLLSEHPEWRGSQELQRIFLVHCPEAGSSLDDETSPYYTAKRLLLEAGVPCQMVDTPTLANPDYKDMNLALNVVAKCGVIPWVLPQSMPDADFLVGLSHTQSRRGGLASRQMGFANVFDEYGRWKFYSGGTQAFSYDERADHYGRLVRATLSKLNLSDDPSVVFHTSAKFSREDRMAVLQAARAVRPRGTYAFVWINTQHHVRLYDDRPETDGSVARGRYAIASPNQIYLSTTGYNPYRRALGTPHVLEVNARVERPPGAPPGPPDLRAIAAQILSLTKLNWASSDSLCAEPITTKYAGDIAYLTAAFMRQSAPEFQLHPVLERTPWFL